MRARLTLAFCCTTASLANGQQQIPVADVKLPAVKAAWSNLAANNPDSIRIGDVKLKATDVSVALNRTVTASSAPTCANGDVSCLSDGFAILDYSMEYDAAVKTGIILGAVGGGVSRKVFVHDLMFIKKDVDEAINPRTWGSGVRLVIIATTGNASANFSSLPAIAASAEFNYTSATYELRSVGVTGPKIAAAIPAAASYNIETHVALMKAIDQIRDAMSDPSTVITPRVVSLTLFDVPFFSERIARMWAWHSIMAGLSCDAAKRGMGGGHTRAAEAFLESEYRLLTNQCDNRPSPDLNLRQTFTQAFANAGVR